ncbi:transglycosylase family protein [Streptomyces formicae]
MLSGNGRHRRPRQAPALIVAAGVTGSAIAIPLLGATSASAADTATWDKLAECESGGAWSANPGNGYYGGIQFSQEMWENYGGLDYAPSADQASKSQQIAVAEKVLDDKGPAAWPSCAPIAGLTDDGAAADVDPGAPMTPVPSDSADPGSDGKDKTGEKSSDKPSEKPSEKPSDKSSGKSSGKPSEEPSDSADPSDPADPSDASDASRDKDHDKPGKGDKSDKGETDGKGDAGDSGKSGGKGGTSPGPEDSTAPSDDSAPGRHRGDSADERPSGGDGKDRTGRHASRGDDRSEKTADGTYTVRSGDNLSVIADDLGVDGGWPTLYAENKKTVGADPDLILPGQSLDLGEK